jgi:hypothetical protein
VLMRLSRCRCCRTNQAEMADFLENCIISNLFGLPSLNASAVLAHRGCVHE